MSSFDPFIGVHLEEDVCGCRRNYEPTLHLIVSHTNSQADHMYLRAIIRNRLRSAPLVVGVAVLGASFALYLSTLAPTLTWGWEDKGVDGGELLAAANTFGIPHSPGYPTYTLLLKSFATLVPVGDFAYRGNLLSAVLASASIFMVYWVILRFCQTLRPHAPGGLAIAGAALGSAALATSPIFWSQAIITEVYALNALFVAALLLIASDLALRPPSDQTEGRPSVTLKLALFGLLLGIGLGNHLTLLAVAAPLLYWLWSALGWRKLASPWTIGAFILGTSVYVYLPISASQNPPVNWGDADTLGGIIWMLSARPYQEYVFGVPTEALLDRFISWGHLVFSQFNPLGLFLGLMSVGPLFSRTPRFFIPALAAVVVVSIYAITFNSADFEVLLIPAFLLFSVWIGFGFFWVASNVIEAIADSEKPLSLGHWTIQTRHVVPVLSLLAILLLPAMLVILNYGEQNLRNDTSARDHARDVLKMVPDGSVVLSDTEKNVFSLWYMRYVEQPERDVAVIAVRLLQFDWYRRDVRRRFPERVPAITASDYPNSLDRIVEHNDGGAPVFITYRLSSTSIDLERKGRVYEATLKEG